MWDPYHSVATIHGDSWESLTQNDKDPGLSAGAVPSLARATGKSPESAVPGATRGKNIFCLHKRVSLLLARPDQTATACAPLKLALLDSRLTFKVRERFMIGLLQRVIEASVSVEGRIVGEIGPGLLVLVAVHRDDTPADISRLAERVLTYRVFPDSEGRMNRSLIHEGHGLLAVPQFTLAADTKKGTRASFTKAAEPSKGSDYFDRFVEICESRLPDVQAGEFGANMKVALINDGPVTFWLES